MRRGVSPQGLAVFSFGGRFQIRQRHRGYTFAQCIRAQGTAGRSWCQSECEEHQVFDMLLWWASGHSHASNAVGKDRARSGSREGEWDFRTTVGKVRNSYGNGEWNCPDGEILDFLQRSRAVKVNGRFGILGDTPQTFVQLLCNGSSEVRSSTVRIDLTIFGFLLPEYEIGAKEFQQLNWNNAGIKFKAATPLMASIAPY